MSGELDAAAAVLLGVIEGIAEWLPISSTGHLTVTASLLGIRGDAANSYAISIRVRRRWSALERVSGRRT